MKNAIFILLVCLAIGISLEAQDSFAINLDTCYQLAKKNYPLVRQYGLIEKTRLYTIDNASKGFLPQVNFGGQASYQSDVTTFPTVPGLKFPVFYKDQYKIYAEVDQLLYDGGSIRNQKEAAQLDAEIREQDLEVNLYTLRARINQVYFGILLLDEQIRQVELQKADIQNGIDKAKAALANGTAFRSYVDELQAEWLKAERGAIEFRASRKAWLEILSLFIHRPLDDRITLVRPPAAARSEAIHRPELLLFEYRKKSADLQDKIINTSFRPRLNLFLQGGYSRPGLDFLNPDFAWYYIGGIKFNWSLGTLYSRNNQRHLADLQRNSLDIEKETFLFNTQVDLQMQSAEVTKYEVLMKADDEIIALRTAVKKASLAQLENGVATAHDYLAQVNSENQAKQELILHQVQWLLAQYNYQNLSGN